ncbi:MAG: cyclic nucleotide-binding domain-containing protein [Cyclobacteriaceae bacterium]
MVFTTTMTYIAKDYAKVILSIAGWDPINCRVSLFQGNTFISPTTITQFSLYCIFDRLEILRKHIEEHYPQLTAPEFNFIASRFQKTSASKGQVLLKEHAICKEVHFAINGTFKYYLEEDGQISITHFGFEEYWLGDLYSMMHNVQAKLSIMALEDCDLLRISASELIFIFENSKPFKEFQRIKRERSYEAAISRTVDVYRDPKKRLISLIEKKPDFLSKIKLNEIAQYLKISTYEL